MIKLNLNERQFTVLQQKAFSLTGIALPESKSTMLINRLKPRMLILELTRIEEYITYLDHHEKEEKQHFVNAITTTMSHFYREHHHYEYVIEQVRSKEECSTGNFDFNVWSAGCSSGEEPYTMGLMFCYSQFKKCHPKILATDINTQMLTAAREGIYRWSDICEVPSEIIKGYFKSFKNDLGQERYQISEDIKNMVQLKKFNLMNPFDDLGKFDAIFCRNVMIYFDEKTRDELIDKFLKQLKPKGLFITGHSEVFDYVSRGLKLVGKTIYEKGEEA